MPAYPTILGCSFSDSLEKFFSALSDHQVEYVKQKYKDYMFAAVGRPYDEEGIFAEQGKAKTSTRNIRLDARGAFVKYYTCLNMEDADCTGIEESYSYALWEALGSSAYPFGAAPEGFFVTSYYGNPVRLAWIMAVLGVSFSKRATKQLLTLVLGRSEYSLLNDTGLCDRLNGQIARVEIQRAFNTCGLSQGYPFGKCSYFQPRRDSFSGMYDPRRMSFLLGCIILGCWQNSIEAPTPGTSAWQDILRVAYEEEGGLTDAQKQKYFRLAFGIEHYEDISEMLYGPVVGFAKVACLNTGLSSWIIPFMVWAAAAVILYGLHMADCIASIIGSSGAH